MTAGGKVSSKTGSARPVHDEWSGKKPLRILIADDHDIVHHGLKKVLLDYFGEIEWGEARTAEETMELCADKKWDVILLDIFMPGRCGLDILADLQRLSPSVPVLIISGYPEEEFAIHALKRGAAGYLTKRSLGDAAVTAIKRVLKGERYISSALASKLAGQIADRGSAPAHETLSTREFQVLCLIASGKTIKEIAFELSLSEKTVGTYRTRISEKLGLGTNVELTRYAIRHQLVD